MSSFGVDDVIARVVDAAFGRPLVTNVLRGHVVEAMIALALEPNWQWCASDYSAWDFERANGTRLEVKQSSWLQTWDAPAHGKVYPSFDIRTRSGRWEGPKFVSELGRAAHIYAFAYHGIRDETADHRDPRQWEFYVVPTRALPPIKKIALSGVRALATAVDLYGLAAAIDAIIV